MKKRSKKESREAKVLFGLVELYLKTGKPIGSHTLKDQGFEGLSSATIRNYFSNLEHEGFLKQPHPSGGRIPTEKAYKVYAEEMLSHTQLEPQDEERLHVLKDAVTKNLTTYLHEACELCSKVTGYASFLSSVRFDHDFVLDIKLIAINAKRVLCLLITDFGQILTEELSLEMKLSTFTLKRLESYFLWRLTGQKEKEKPENLSIEEEKVANAVYNEIMVRYLVRYSNFTDEEIHRTGFSQLLTYPEFSDPMALASGLSLFENLTHLRLLLSDCIRQGGLSFWVGSDLLPYAVKSPHCSVIAVPYKIGQMTAGALGILGPSRMPYRTLFGALQLLSASVSQALTKNFYKFKLSFRQPRSSSSREKEERILIERNELKLIEIKEKK